MDDPGAAASSESVLNVDDLALLTARVGRAHARARVRTLGALLDGLPRTRACSSSVEAARRVLMKDAAVPPLPRAQPTLARQPSVRTVGDATENPLSPRGSVHEALVSPQLIRRATSSSMSPSPAAASAWQLRRAASAPQSLSPTAAT